MNSTATLDLVTTGPASRRACSVALYPRPPKDLILGILEPLRALKGLLFGYFGGLGLHELGFQFRFGVCLLGGMIWVQIWWMPKR